ncbi:transglutaminaseTgpA domain-containing protein [Microbacterium sp. bgisy189]|uniref:transglutaminase family protein n=1 Tax=Microbacterium sp. bgisy189 TaxID=3413798 RepID=UPI003EB79FD7
MSADGSPDRRAPTRGGTTRLAIGLFAALAAAIVPLTGVIEVAGWLWQSVFVAGGLLAAGWVARRLRVPTAAVTIIELALWVVAITFMYFRDTAWFGLVPTVDTLREVPTMVEVATTQIIMGTAPLEPTAPMTALIVTAVGILTIALDHVVITARMPLLATVALIAVWVIPAVAVPSGVNVLSFALLSAAVLYTIRAETRTREAPGTGRGGVTALAAGIGVVAITGSLITTPILPEPVLSATGPGTLTTIDPTLELGDDLRQPAETPVLRYRTNATDLPYLRIATLSTFDGEVWQPDRQRTAQLEDSAFEEVTADEGVRVTEYETTIEVTQLSSAWAPMPFPAVSVDGLEGFWRTMAYNRTVLTSQGNIRGQAYTVTTHVPRPTREQIQDSEAGITETRLDLTQLPGDTPAIIEELAREVTADATNDYDRLRALQSWFRGPEFTYSLTAPVQEGFDGTGAEALEAFLQVKAGYCVHFAAAFATMARSLDMPARVVIGFLPGGYTGEIEEGQRVAEATTAQLHAWPEVHFRGIGWVGFEPTKSLGNETTFLPESVTAPDTGGEDIAGPTPTAAATPSASAAPLDPQDPAGSADALGGGRLVDLRPYLFTLGGLLAVAAAPGLARLVIERRLRRRAAAGSVASAWRIVQNTAIDLGAPAPAAESPRVFGRRLVKLGAKRAEVDRLVEAIEHASYAPGDRPSGDALVDDAIAARRAMLDFAEPALRTRALLLPRSLVVRPGSAFAAAAQVRRTPSFLTAE